MLCFRVPTDDAWKTAARLAEAEGAVIGALVRGGASRATIHG